MEMLFVNLKSGGTSVFGATRSYQKVRLSTLRQQAALGWTVEVSVSAWRRRCRSIVVRAGGKKKNNHDDISSAGQNDPEEDGLDRNTPQFDKSKSIDPSKKSHHALPDWRDFRAYLVAQEQEQLLDGDDLPKDAASHEPFQRPGKWAHPISEPETGCLLVATQKLDGVPNFERTVVLILRLASADPREGPLGVILNHPLHKKIEYTKPSNPDLATIFADCSLHYGGPVKATYMFLLRIGDKPPHPDFGEVVSGVCFGTWDSIDRAAALVKKGVLKPQDIRFFDGCARWWHIDQLRYEIESDYWVVAACSSTLINESTFDSSSDLWEETLQLMGGQYADLSRKPKPDDS